VPTDVTTVGAYDQYEALKLSLVDSVMTVTISNPGKRNALSPRMLEELSDIWDDLNRDPEVKLIVLTGEGDDFCSGADLSSLGEHVGTRGRRRRGGASRTHVMSLLECDKPVLAKVRGVAYGLGVNMALACDMVFAAQSARFCDSHVKAGMVAGDGGVMLWPLAVGMHRAKQYLMTGEPIPAPVAEQIGLINACVPDAELDEHVEAMARKLAALPPLAVNYTKRALNLALKQMTALASEASLAYEMYTMKSEDFTEALKAFSEKRKGVYKGS
jgi:enoyl-CoA hydratase